MSVQNKGDEVSTDFKSKFLSDAEIMKEKLDSVSPSMCLAKWKQVSLHLTTGHTNSCYHPPLHKIRIEDIQRSPSGIHNTEHKKQQRKLMLEGIRPSECSYCWTMEDNGKLSDRHYRSGEPWDEGYDQDPINWSVFEIMKIIDDLSNLSTKNMLDMYRSMEDVLEHNRRTLLDLIKRALDRTVSAQ